MVRILDERREALVERERELLERLVAFLKNFGAPPEDVDLVRRALSDLEELFLLVIVGEFNSGKSVFVNALLGADISEEGVTPTKGAETGFWRRGIPMSSCVRLPSSIRLGPTRSSATTRSFPGASCRGVTWCCSSPPPSGPSLRASAGTSSSSATGGRRSCSSSTRPTSWPTNRRSRRFAPLWTAAYVRLSA